MEDPRSHTLQILDRAGKFLLGLQGDVVVLHLLVYLIHVYDQLGEALVFCACIYIHKKVILVQMQIVLPRAQCNYSETLLSNS